MIQYNPHLVGALMADRERQIRKQALLREIRRAKQEQIATTAAMPMASPTRRNCGPRLWVQPCRDLWCSFKKKRGIYVQRGALNRQ